MPSPDVRAQILTIGTEITAGEIVNSNAAWVSQRLEEQGIRVYAHLSVRDHTEELHRALLSSREYDLVIVTGGLGPTTDDITRASLAHFAGVHLEFSEVVWRELQELHQSRGLAIRPSHRHQCYFPKDSEPLPNPVGSALGFLQSIEGRPYFVLPGPPNELEGMWHQSVAARTLAWASERSTQLRSYAWKRWTCLGPPESEVAEKVEAAIFECLGAESQIEVGYRAAVPFIKVKLFLNETLPEHRNLQAAVDTVLQPFLIGEGDVDLAMELLKRWPKSTLHVLDSTTGPRLANRLFTAQQQLLRLGHSVPELTFQLGQLQKNAEADLYLQVESESEYTTRISPTEFAGSETKKLPYKIKLNSERGQRSAVEWALWFVVRQLSARRS